MKRLSSAALVLATWLPAIAWACPVCAGRETNTGLTATLIGLMIAVPYLISVVAIRTIRKADKEAAWVHEPSTAPEASKS